METPEKHLNDLLQGELSAVETYDMALEKMKSPQAAPVLAECRNCHMDRVVKLSKMVDSLGAEPANSSGPWGSFAKLVEGGAAVLGEGSAVGALKEGEDQGLDTYRGALKGDDSIIATLVTADLLPAQEKTQKAITHLYEHMAS